MTRPIDTCESIVNAMTTDSFHFIYGTKPEQNNDVDELDFKVKNGVCFLDIPIQSDVVNTKPGTKLTTTPLTLFFAYPINLDATPAQKKSDLQKAWDAAREFSIRLRRVKGVNNIKNEKYLDIDQYQSRRYDMNLGGCLLTISYEFQDNDSICYT